MTFFFDRLAINLPRHSPIAQLVEQVAVNHRVRGSSPRWGAILSHIEPNWCAEVIAAPLRSERQPDGRIRFWGAICSPGVGKSRILWVLTLKDGETTHNAIFDRRFRKEKQ